MDTTNPGDGLVDTDAEIVDLKLQLAKHQSTVQEFESFKQQVKKLEAVLGNQRRSLDCLVHLVMDYQYNSTQSARKLQQANTELSKLRADLARSQQENDGHKHVLAGKDDTRPMLKLLAKTIVAGDDLQHEQDEVPLLEEKIREFQSSAEEMEKSWGETCDRLWKDGEAPKQKAAEAKEELAQANDKTKRLRRFLELATSTDYSHAQRLFNDETILDLLISFQNLAGCAETSTLKQWCGSIVLDHQPKYLGSAVHSAVINGNFFLGHTLPWHGDIIAFGRKLMGVDLDGLKLSLVIVEYCMKQRLRDLEAAQEWEPVFGMAWLRSIELIWVMHWGGTWRNMRLRELTDSLSQIDLTEARKSRLVDKFYHYLCNIVAEQPNDIEDDRGFGCAIPRYVIEGEFSFIRGGYFFVIDIDSLIVATPDVDDSPVRVISSPRLSLKMEGTGFLLTIKDFEVKGSDYKIELKNQEDGQPARALRSSWKETWGKMMDQAQRDS